MPYAPGVEFRGGELLAQGITSAAGSLSDATQKALARYEEDKQKRQFNEGIFEFLKDQTDSQGKPYLDPKVFETWNRVDPDKQAGMISLAGARFQQDIQRQQQESFEPKPIVLNDPVTGKPASFFTSGPKSVTPFPGAVDEGAIQPKALIDPNTGQPIPGQFVIPKTGRVVETNKSKTDQDNWQKLDKDFHAVTGAPLGDWTNANRQMSPDGKFVTAVIPGKAIGQFGARSPDRTVKIPASQYDKLMGRYSRLAAAEGPASAGAADATTQGGTQFTPQQQSALQWAQANPNDPRAAAILKKLGL